MDELKIDVLDILDESLKITKLKPKKRKDIWTKIKEKVIIPDILNLENGRCECLNGQDHPENPSCQYNDSEDVLYCHRCQSTMDVIQVYAIINNLERSEAISELVKQYGIKFGKYDEAYIKTESEIDKSFKDFMKKCYTNLCNNKKLYSFVKENRGFSDRTMEVFNIGLFDDTIKEYMNKKYSNEILQKGGFKDFSKKDKKKVGKLFWKFGKRIVYPYLNRNIVPKYFIYRLIDSEPDFNDKAKYVKQMKTQFIEEIPFGLNSLNSLTIPSVTDFLIITEGITDAISIIQNNISCLSPVTTRIKKKDIEKMISYCNKKSVIVINDNEEFKRNKEGRIDNSGLKGAINTLKVLIKHSVDCSIGIIPNPKKLKKIDLNDYLRPKEQSLEKLNLIINHAIKGFDYLTNTINDKSNQDDVVGLLEILPETDIILQENIFKKLSKKTKINVGAIRRIYQQLPKEKKRGTSQDNKKNEKENNNENNNDIFERIESDLYDIEVRDNGIFKIIWRTDIEGNLHPTEIQILDGKLEMFFKVYDTRLDVKRFTFKFDGVQHNTYTIMNIIHRFEEYIYEGTHGRDIIKKVFNYYSEKIEEKKPEYIAGFNNGWRLPQLEGDNGYTIIVYTDFERNVYENLKNIIKKYSEKEKEEVIKKFQQLVQITQNKDNLIILLAWSLAAPFRLAILEYCNIFPHLFNVGVRLSGKNALEETFITNFYKAYDTMLSPNTLESISRLEDHLSESTFPHVITEIHKVRNMNTTAILKDHATGISHFERKKSAFEIGIKKEKIAGLSIDSNNPIDIFKDPAMNTKIITNEFKRQVKTDPKWKKLNRELKKEKLFSFIYEYTKNWNNINVFQELEKQYNRIQEELGLEGIQKLEKENPRLVSIYQILLFGLELLKNVFDIEIEEGIETILNPVRVGRQFISIELKDQFFAFCTTAINFDEGYQDENGNYRKGNNPKHLQYSLGLNKQDTHYCFTQNNLRDFNEFSKKNYHLKELNNLMLDCLKNNGDMQYVNKRFNNHRTRYIQINRDLF